MNNNYYPHDFALFLSCERSAFFERSHAARGNERGFFEDKAVSKETYTHIKQSVKGNTYGACKQESIISVLIRIKVNLKPYI